MLPIVTVLLKNPTIYNIKPSQQFISTIYIYMLLIITVLLTTLTHRKLDIPVHLLQPPVLQVSDTLAPLPGQPAHITLIANFATQ